MRNINDYINEHLNVNEGLIGDIIRKLLDTGLRWIEGSVKYIADKSVDATKEIWHTHKDYLIDEYDRIMRHNPQLRKDHKLPRHATNPEEAGIGLFYYFFDEDFDKIPAKDRIEKAKDVIKRLKTRRGDQDKIDKQIAIIVAQCYVGIMRNKNASDKDKELVNAFLKEIKSKESKNINDHIDGAIDEYNNV